MFGHLWPVFDDRNAQPRVISEGRGTQVDYLDEVAIADFDPALAEALEAKSQEVVHPERG